MIRGAFRIIKLTSSQKKGVFKRLNLILLLKVLGGLGFDFTAFKNSDSKVIGFGMT